MKTNLKLGESVFKVLNALISQMMIPKFLVLLRHCPVIVSNLEIMLLLTIGIFTIRIFRIGIAIFTVLAKLCQEHSHEVSILEVTQKTGEKEIDKYSPLGRILELQITDNLSSHDFYR